MRFMPNASDDVYWHVINSATCLFCLTERLIMILKGLVWCSEAQACGKMVIAGDSGGTKEAMLLDKPVKLSIVLACLL